MELSIIIVNYNVKLFLEQCLYSVTKAMHGTDAEIIVVDNHSSDRSIEYLRPIFPGVQFIINTNNIGFAKACNIGAEKSVGRILLFLNPDTIVPEDCFTKLVSFFNTHSDAGAVGVRMIDGSGKFLKESKRAFPSPFTSFFKLTGLSSLFPSSPTFAKYHLGHLDEKNDHPVDVLAGAFLAIDKQLFYQIGKFDEVFFMYGEDIDLSYRAQQSGKTNYYFSGTTVIHFKGESTRKSSLNYVKMFYSAMSVFVRKHYGGSKAAVFNFFIQSAIWIRAGFAALTRFIVKIGLPIIDAALILLSFWVMTHIWQTWVRPGIVYEKELLRIAFPIFTLLYLFVAWYAGLYDKVYRKWHVFRSTLVATLALLVVYALLPEHYRFSRAIVLFGAALAFVFISIIRSILIETGVIVPANEDHARPHLLIAGTVEEAAEVTGLLKATSRDHLVLGRVSVNDNSPSAIMHISNMNNANKTVAFDEIIFCEGTLSYADIIDNIQHLPHGVKSRFHASGSKSIVGSHSKDQAGEVVSTEKSFKLSDPYSKRIKRLVDVMSCIFFLVTFPIHFFTQKNAGVFFSRCFSILAGKSGWIGYAGNGEHLPTIRSGVLSANGTPVSIAKSLPVATNRTIDEWYAVEYEPMHDVKLILQHYGKLSF